MGYVKSVLLALAVSSVAAAAAYATYGDPPTKKDIRTAKGPISSIVEVNRGATSGIRGTVYTSEKPRELYMTLSVVGFPAPVIGQQLNIGLSSGRCGQPAGRVFPVTSAVLNADYIHLSELVVATPVRRLRRSITLRTKALRLSINGVEVGCGTVIVLRFSNEDPNP